MKLHAKLALALIWKSAVWPVSSRCWTLEPCIKTRIHKNEKKNSIEINIGHGQKHKNRHERRLKTVRHEDAVEWRDSKTGHIFKTYQQINWKIIWIIFLECPRLTRKNRHQAWKHVALVRKRKHCVMIAFSDQVTFSFSNKKKWVENSVIDVRLTSHWGSHQLCKNKLSKLIAKRFIVKSRELNTLSKIEFRSLSFDLKVYFGIQISSKNSVGFNFFCKYC